MFRSLDKTLLRIYFVWFFIIFLFLFFVPIISSVLTDNLVSYYKLDEISGTTAEDSHSTNDGTVNNARVFTSEAAGIINTDADFTQGDDYIGLGTLGTLGSTWSDGPGSVSLWVKGIDYTNSQDIIGETTSTGYSKDPFFRLYTNYNNVGGVGLLVRAGASSSYSLYIVTGDHTIDSGDWTHVVVTWNHFNDDTSVHFWINNVDEDLTTILDTYGTYNISDFTNFMIGAMNNRGTPGTFYDGEVDEVGFYTRQLNSTEVSELYNSGAGLQYPFVAGPSDTCTCLGAGNDWEIDMSDNCNITDACNLGTGKLSFTGSGFTNCNATINTTNLGDTGSSGILYIQDSCLIEVN